MKFNSGQFWRFCRALRVDTKEKGAVSLSRETLLGTQTYLIEEIAKGLNEGVHHFTILKGRQLGITTICLALDLYWIFKHKGLNGSLVTHDEPTRDDNRATLTMYMDGLPVSWKVPHEVHNRTQLVLKNRSKFTYQVAGTRKNTKLGKGKALTFLHSCVSPDTPVVIDDGRIKAISDVRIGDYILTHTGVRSKVIDAIIQPNDKGDLIRITPWMGQSLCFTGEHTIPTQRGIVEAKDIRDTDLLVMPVRKITDEREPQYIPPSYRDAPKNGRCKCIQTIGADTYFELNEEIGYSIGYYLAEGNMTRNTVTGTVSGFCYTRHRNEIAYADRAIKALSGLMNHKRTEDRKGCLTSVEHLYGAGFSRWVDEHFGSVDEKRIPDYVFKWGEDFCRGLITGLLCGDGSKTDSIVNGKYAVNKVVLPTTRSSIAMQARDIVASLGIGWASISYDAGGDKYGRNCKPSWRVNWNGDAAFKLRKLMGIEGVLKSRYNRSQKYKIENGQVWIKIRKIEYGIKSEMVCDLSVEHDDHTFRTPHFSIGNTETSEYGDEEGIASLEASLAQENPNRLFIYETTAQGYNAFYDMWKDAKMSVAKRAIFIGWWRNQFYRKKKDSQEYRTYWDGKLSPEERKWVNEVKRIYDFTIDDEQIAWWRWCLAEVQRDEQLMYQNYPPTENYAFIKTGSNFFNIARVNDEVKAAKKLEYKNFRFILRQEFEDCELTECGEKMGNLKVWDMPVQDGHYVIGADPAYGSSEWADRFCCAVYRCYSDGMDMVAEFNTPDCTTYQFAWVICHLAGAYSMNKGSTCMLNLEINGPGQAVWAEMTNLKRIAANSRSESAKGVLNVVSSIQNFFYKRPDSFGPPSAYHTISSQREKERMFNCFKDGFERGIIKVKSAECIDEMTNVERDDGFLGAPGRGKDDRIVASALATVAWVDYVRMRMVQMGLSRSESASKVSGGDNVSSMNTVSNYLKKVGIGR